MSAETGGSEGTRLRRAWRSVFRVGWPKSDRDRSAAVLSSLVLHLHPTRVTVRALRFSRTLGLGLVGLYLLAILTVTGLALMFYYVPHPAAAYRSISTKVGAFTW